MSERLRALDRIAAVQRQVKRIADWRLAEAEREAAEAAEAQAAIDAWIADDTPRGLLAEAAVKQARRTALRGERAASAVTAAAAVAREAGARDKLVERRRGAITREERSAEERKALERLVEAFAARGPLADES